MAVSRLDNANTIYFLKHPEDGTIFICICKKIDFYENDKMHCNDNRIGSSCSIVRQQHKCKLQ